MHYMIEWITFGSEEFLHCPVLIRPSIKERFSLLVQCGARVEGQIISIPSVQKGCVVLFVWLLLFPPHPSCDLSTPLRFCQKNPSIFVIG